MLITQALPRAREFLKRQLGKWWEQERHVPVLTERKRVKTIGESSKQRETDARIHTDGHKWKLSKPVLKKAPQYSRESRVEHEERALSKLTSCCPLQAIAI